MDEKAIARFRAKVDRSGGPDACHPFVGGRQTDGYGTFKLDGKAVLAHRVAFFLEHGRWPEPECRHSCHWRPCCNAAHLSEGTHGENMADLRESGNRKGRCLGASNGRAKLTPDQFREIRALRGKQRRVDIAHCFEISEFAVTCIQLRRTWASVE